jgi:hypothetical protein
VFYPTVCRYFMSEKGCFRGDACRFLHVVPQLLTNQEQSEDDEEEDEEVQSELSEPGDEEEEENEDDQEEAETENVPQVQLVPTGPHLRKCRTMRCASQMLANNASPQCSYCIEWQDKLGRLFVMDGKSCGTPTCSNDPGPHNFCYPCYYQRKIEFLQSEKTRTEAQIEKEKLSGNSASSSSK